MNLDDKLKQLAELKKIYYPSDQEYQQIEQLEEEIQSMTNEVIQPKITKEIPTKQNTTRTKGGLLRKILRVTPKEPPKPVTQTELEQLTMEARKQEILARIAKAKGIQANEKAKQPGIFASIKKVIGESTNNPFDVSSNKKKDYNPFRW